MSEPEVNYTVHHVDEFDEDVVKEWQYESWQVLVSEKDGGIIAQFRDHGLAVAVGMMLNIGNNK